MKYFVNDVCLADGDETVPHGSTSFQISYSHESELFFRGRELDLVIEIDHTALLEMIEKASHAKNRKYAEGPLVIRVNNVKNSPE